MMCSGSVYFQFVQIPHKETPFLSCTIRVQSGRNRKTSSQDAMQAMKTAHLRQKPGGAAPLKKHCPLLMRGNSQGSGQTTNHLLTAANVWEFSYTASAAFSSFPRRCLFLYFGVHPPPSGFVWTSPEVWAGRVYPIHGKLNLSVSLRSPAPLIGEPLAFRCVCIVTQ